MPILPNEQNAKTQFLERYDQGEPLSSYVCVFIQLNVLKMSFSLYILAHEYYLLRVTLSGCFDT